MPRLDESSDQLAFEGRLDLDLQIIMAVAPHVRRYVEQPETFQFSVDGCCRRYTPDGLAYTTYGRIYVEVKPAVKLARSPDLDGRLPSIIKECAKRGGGFSILTEREIRDDGKLLANSKAVWSASHGIDPEEVQRACRALRPVAFPAPMKDLTETLGPRCWTIAKALIGLRYLAADLSLPFSESSVIARGCRDW